MERNKLNGLIQEKNERIERKALRNAESIIESIASPETIKALREFTTLYQRDVMRVLGLEE